MLPSLHQRLHSRVRCAMFFFGKLLMMAETNWEEFWYLNVNYGAYITSFHHHTAEKALTVRINVLIARNIIPSYEVRVVGVFAFEDLFKTTSCSIPCWLYHWPKDESISRKMLKTRTSLSSIIFLYTAMVMCQLLVFTHSPERNQPYMPAGTPGPCCRPRAVKSCCSNEKTP